MEKEEEEDSLMADKARIDPVDDAQFISQTASPSRNIRPPPNSPKKHTNTLGSPKRKITRAQIDQINR